MSRGDIAIVAGNVVVEGEQSEGELEIYQRTCSAMEMPPPPAQLPAKKMRVGQLFAFPSASCQGPLAHIGDVLARRYAR